MRILIRNLRKKEKNSNSQIELRTSNRNEYINLTEGIKSKPSIPKARRA